MTEHTRIAPTPSGFLHAGNGVSFLLTARIAQQLVATLRLRIDDLDSDRSRPAYTEDIFSSLAWLGIEWSEGPRNAREQERDHSQLKRLGRYEEFIGTLKEQGDLYACACSRSVLRDLARRGRPTCECRNAGHDFRSSKVTWRLRLPSDGVVRMERLFGEPLMLSPAALMPDPVIKQRTVDGTAGRPAYQIASLIEDVDHGITLIVRGEDLLASTACQLYLADRLGLEAFKHVRFLHHPLLLDANGTKLSKSEGAEALRTMRANGLMVDGLREQASAMLTELQQLVR